MSKDKFAGKILLADAEPVSEQLTVLKMNFFLQNVEKSYLINTGWLLEQYPKISAPGMVK